MIYLYKILGFILIPYIKLNVWRRIKKEKELKDLLLWVEPVAGKHQGSPDKRKRRLRRAIKEQQN